MIELYRGERRLVAVNLAEVLAEGDSLTGTPTATLVVKRGRAPTDYVDASPGPVVDGTEVQCWVEVPEDAERANYLLVVTCATANGEVAKEEAPVLVE